MAADNPLYGEYADEELRVDLFQPPSDDETEGTITINILIYLTLIYLTLIYLTLIYLTLLHSYLSLLR